MSQTTTETLDVDNLICGLKAAVTALECQYKMELQKKQMLVPRHKKSVKENNSDFNKKCKKKSESRSTISCNQSGNEKLKQKNHTKKQRKEKEDECAFISPEMRGGVIYTRCECLFRNGLQEDCPLTLCQGQPDCLINPWAECPPGKYFRARHPEIYTAPPNPNALTL